MSKHERRRGPEASAGAGHAGDAHEHGAGHRHARLQQILCEELAALVRDELTDPRLDGVIITGVELSVDYRNARVRFWAQRPGPIDREERERLERALTRAAPFLRSYLADAVDIKQVPSLRFVWDREADERPGVHAME
jgi:ribosome-binding factor A